MVQEAPVECQIATWIYQTASSNGW